MAGNLRRTGGAAANGFAPRTLLKEQTEALRDNGYPVPPDMRVGHGFVIGVNGVPVTKPLTRANRGFAAAVNTRYWRDLTPEQRQDPRWDPRNPANHGRYEAAFQRAYEEDFNRWDGPGPAPTDKNVAGREAFWSVPGRTLQFVMNHIANGGSLLTAAPAAPPPPPANQWVPRATPSSSRASSSRSSSSRSRASSLLTPKPEQMKVKAEPELSPFMAELIAAQAGTDDDAIAAVVAAASMDDVPPLDGPSACAWSARDTAKEKGVPFFDLTVDDGPGLSRVKEEYDGGAWSTGGAGSSGGVKEEEDGGEHPYAAFRRRHGRH